MPSKFPTVLRGYDIRQVDELVAIADDALASAEGSARDAAVSRLRTSQLQVKFRGYSRSNVNNYVEYRILQLSMPHRGQEPAPDFHREQKMPPTEGATPAPQRLVPLLDQFDWARTRLHDRMSGPEGDSGTGTPIKIPPMTDDEYLWEPVPGCWSIRRRAAGPGPAASLLVGAGEWGRDSAPFPHPWPPPFTTIAWRLGHLSEMLTLRADHMIGSHALTRDDYRFSGDAAGGIAAFDTGAEAWRAVLLSAGDATLDSAGRSTYPYGSDPEDPFIETAWWVNQEVLHHGAEIALLRDLHRAQQGQ